LALEAKGCIKKLTWRTPSETFLKHPC